MGKYTAGLVTLFFAVMMLLTGTINTIATKSQDISVKGGFNHPFFQTAAMFLGEFLCLLVFALLRFDCIHKRVEGDKPKTPLNFNPVWLLIPACCDLGGSTLMNFGLLYTYASVYQMLRGTLVIFTGILAVIFLKQRLWWHHWGGMLLILIGTAMVGLSSVLFGDKNSAQASNPLFGDILVIAAQVIAAVQFVVEEKLLAKYDIPPLQCVGWEGLWGFSVVSVLLVIFYFIPGQDLGSFENAPAAFMQMGGDYLLLLSVLGSVISIAFFNFFGISITKRVSSTTRSTIDSCRTLFIWVVSLIIGWETFSWLQLGGFSVLVLGTFVYNEVIRIPVYHTYYRARAAAYEAEKQSLIKGDSQWSDATVQNA